MRRRIRKRHKPRSKNAKKARGKSVPTTMAAVEVGGDGGEMDEGEVGGEMYVEGDVGGDGVGGGLGGGVGQEYDIVP